MGLIQNKVTVSQPNSHVVVKNAGGLRGLTGETGPQGPQGVPGEAATVTAGTTTTLPAGSDATVQNVGSTSAAIFNFGIPKGDKGDTGESGAAATISVGTTTTLEPGEDATVTNTGTSSAAVFDFGIPKGAKGDTGDTGPAGQDGADGFSPTATVSKTGDTATITITDKDGTTTAQISDGVTPTIDPALSPTSENPVQNKVVTNALAGKADKPIVVSSLPATGTAGQEYFVDDRYNTVTELKGDTEQTTYSGKNKAKYNATYSANGIDSVLNSDGSLTCSGTTTTTYFNTLPYQATLPSMLPAGTYTFSRGGDTTYAVQIQLWDSTKNQTLTFRIPAGQTKITDTTTFDAYYYGSSFVYLSANMQINTTVKLQLESGSTATSFEPYVGGTASPNPDYPQEVQTVTGRQVVTITDGGSENQEYEVNLGKNLFDKDNFPSVDGFIRADNYTLTSSASNKTTYIKANPNTTYTFSGFTLGVALVVGTFNGVPVLGDVANARVLKGASATTVTITTGTSDSYIAFMYKTSSDELDTSAFQIEKGSTSTTYAPYFTPIELCKIGTYRDYIYKSGEDWYVKKNINKVALNGSESWETTGTNVFALYISGGIKSISEGLSGVCDYYTFNPVQTNVTITLTTGQFAVQYINPNTQHRLFMKNTAISTTSDFQTWLGSHNTTVYYPIATPTDIQITNADLITQLEALAGAKIMVDGGTATVTSQYLPATLTTAYNSNSGYIDYIYDGTNFVKVR